MKIERTINAAIGATYDRRTITKLTNNMTHMETRKNIDRSEQLFYAAIKRTSGRSTHNPIKAVRSWIKAYKNNIKKLKMVEEINRPFQKPSIAQKIINKIIKK